MVKVLIADDHAIVRRGLKQILEEQPDIKVLGEAQNAQEVLEKIRSENWDALILDISMPGRTGLEILKEIKQERPKLPVLVLSVHAEDQYALRVLKGGASGYLTKETAPAQLVDALRKVLRGGKYISGALAEKMAFDLEHAERPPHQLLSDREYQVLCLIASGKTVKEISQNLVLSEKTVSTYRVRILEKMQMKSNAELTHYAIKNNLVE